MMVSRICTGLGIGMVFPCLNSLLSNWAPARERCTLSSIPFASTQLSTVINHALTNYMIMKSNTWSTPYYVYGSIGIAWSLVWHLTADSAPWTSSLISQHELDYLKREMGENLST
jgi:MFS family permease